MCSDGNVVNLHNVDDIEAWLSEDKNNVYVGRDSKWGNPYRLKDYGRGEVLQLFEKYFLGNKKLCESIGELTGKVLGWWCAPLECHADILHKLANQSGLTVSTEPKKKMSMEERLSQVENELRLLKSENATLRLRVDVLESKATIASKVADTLAKDLDRLDQYHRRSNIVLKFVDLPKKNTFENDQELVEDLLAKELKIPDAIKDIDKIHRIGKIRNDRAKAGKSNQDIIVRFRSHQTRYEVYKQRKKASKIKIRPNLTKRRSDTLYKAQSLAEKTDGVEFVYANTHGDLSVKLSQAINEKTDFGFSTMTELKSFLNEKGFEIPIDNELDDQE